MIIDSHCHLGIGDYKPDIDAYLKNAAGAGVTSILTVACCENDAPDLSHMLSYRGVYGAIGCHPENAAHYKSTTDLKNIIKSTPKIVAVGEIGLDYHWGTEHTAAQKTAFQDQILLAHELDLPIIIHTRDAEEDTIALLTDMKSQGIEIKGVFHCFTGSALLAKQALDLGFYISAAGIITFKKSDELRTIFATIPLNRLLLETDYPYLAPVPHRGHENQPAYTAETARTLAHIKGVSFDEIAAATTHNFKTLFKIKELETL
ncbi:MAG: TatD family hydrolase [Lactobacillales bacterium]|jgi:TatD DNase family protein|nr:TatD family hydrolase [Lactobacillales bacterium]